MFDQEEKSSCKLLVLYLCGGEASIIVLLARQPSDDAGGVSQVFSSRRGSREFGQQHIGADLHRQRS